ncbi:acyltransferase family protein [Roseobacter sp. MH60115]|uniref:acyltransferase family protein n=1 Tax=Roseobacter sp. MH60115 TaxID=2785324 RepID=UPI0018A273A3|nr:acyltransferase family protein [Roseobacter sp. MH60115]
MKYRPEIDGLRMVAVLPVILFHAGFTFFSGGFVGVDVFFVISGYLITTILITELEAGRFSILRFYERRARRILPALFTVMLCCLPFAWLWMFPAAQKDFAQSLVAVVFFASNFLFWKETDYFATAAEEKPLLHTWSLAVEEQYYLLFPLFLILFWRFGRHRVFWIIAALAAISLLLSEWSWRTRPAANFYLAHTRAWELLAGSLCAFLAAKRGVRGSNLLSAAGLGLIVFAIVSYDETTPFPSFYAVVPVLGAVLIVLFADQRTWVARGLSLKICTGIGLISYSAYLWHQPLFAFARIRSLEEPGEGLMLSLAFAALALAYLTWRFIEKPFRRSPVPALPSQGILFGVSGMVATVFVALGFWGYMATKDLQISREVLSERCNLHRGDCFHLENPGFSVALWGDSYADAFAKSLGAQVREAGGDLALFIKHSCPSILGVTRNEPNRLGVKFADQCRRHNEKAQADIVEGTYDYVVLASSYLRYAEARNLKGMPVLLDHRDSALAADQAIAGNMVETVRAIRAAGAEVILVTPPPRVPDFDRQRKLVKFGQADQIYAEVEGGTDISQMLLSRIAAANIPVKHVNTISYFCGGADCPVITEDGRLKTYDGSHISTVLSPVIAKAVLDATWPR